MNTFPDIQKPSFPLDDEIEDSTIRSEMDDGTVVTRLRFTKIRHTYTLNWDALPDADYQELVTFLTETVKMGALSFSWTNPRDSTVHTVRLKSMGKFSGKAVNIWSGSITLQEV